MGKQGKMVEIIKENLKKIWNIINGSDKNWDGKVDIDDKMIEAQESAKEKLGE
mgnify:FL=1